MLDNLYYNIGGKIKNWAKWIFVIDAIGAIVTGLVLMFTDGFTSYGFLTLIFGPIVAWVGSWFLYAFGELVEKTCDNEYNTRMIVKLLKENDGKKTNRVETTTYNSSSEQKATNTTTNNETHVDRSSQNARYTTTENNTIICSSCNFEQPANRKVCWHCGAKLKEYNNDASHRWLCDGCNKMRTQSPCEHCGKE